MNKETVYRSLEDRMLKYSDLADVPVKPLPENMVVLRSRKYLTARPINEDMRPYTGDSVYVRKSVKDKLNQAALYLQEKGIDLQLQVVYGYRALEVQKKLFNKYKKRFEPLLSGDELLEATHRLVAVPTVAGHPTGGAVDVRLLQNDALIPMGTGALEFVQDSYTFSPYISEQAKVNRLLLREVMLGAGFAPFDGEWWHFSYGDREWARYYNKPCAIYEQLEFANNPIFKGEQDEQG